jgi:hypothetical protein
LPVETKGGSATVAAIPVTEPSPLAARLVAVPRRADQPPTLDGKLDDPIWRDTQPITHFVQRNPVEGALASEATEVYLAYDSSCIYVAFYVHYSDPGLIRANRVDRDTSVHSPRIANSRTASAAWGELTAGFGLARRKCSISDT